MKPNETSTDAHIYWLDLDVAGDLTAYPGGSGWYWTQRTDAGAWVDTNTRRPFIDIIIEDITATGGGGGGETFTGGKFNFGIN